MARAPNLRTNKYHFKGTLPVGIVRLLKRAGKQAESGEAARQNRLWCDSSNRHATAKKRIHHDDFATFLVTGANTKRMKGRCRHRGGLRWPRRDAVVQAKAWNTRNATVQVPHRPAKTTRKKKSLHCHDIATRLISMANTKRMKRGHWHCFHRSHPTRLMRSFK